jgi:hypothetical protein
MGWDGINRCVWRLSIQHYSIPFLEQKFVCLHDGTLHLFRVIRYRFEPDCFLVSHFDNMYELGLQWG